MAFKDITFITNKGLTQLFNLPIGYHLIFGICIRLSLILYADIHDSISDVKYTDIDYNVFTDAARLVVKGESPYERHTYRYSPLIAWILVPNVLFNKNFGKVLFGVCDILSTLIIKSIVQRQLKGKLNAAKVAKYSSLFWLYNPLGIAISTRGSADSLPCLLILLSIFFLQYYKLPNDWRFILSGMFLGVAIHIRLYPIVFSFPMYLSLGDYKITRKTTIREGLLALIPNKKQVMLTITTIIYFGSLTYGMYLRYGYEFIFETYIYHLFRKDTRHNFSLFFYSSYLGSADLPVDLPKITTQIFLFLILLSLSLVFGCDSRTLPFALFCQAAVLVIYNSVVTSQYFIWFLSLFPLIVHDLKTSRINGMFLVVIWIGSQLSWLLFAYLIEFQNADMFLMLWIMCIVFFLSSNLVLYKMIAYYTPGHGFGIAITSAKSKIK